MLKATRGKIMVLEGKLYDSSGTEIIVPDGHQVVIGKNGHCFIPIHAYEATFVYKEPDKNSEKYKKALELCQPERSKREDSCNHEWTGIPTTEESWCVKCGIEDHVYKRCGALNTMET
jgi:hypothetical protein